MPDQESKTANVPGGPTPETLHKRKVAMLSLTAIFLFIGFVWLLHWLIWGEFQEYTDDAYVNGNMVQVMSQIPGTVTEIDVDDTQLVNEGQVILKFDPADTEIALQHAKAYLAASVRQVRQIFENAKRAYADLQLRTADLAKAQSDLDRRKGLIGVSAVSNEEFAHYQTAVETAQAQYDATLHRYRSVMSAVENTHIYTHPLVEQAKATLKTAYLNAERAVVRAPVAGYIAKRGVQIGQRVSVNTPMLAIVPLKETWIDANYKESQLSNLRLGQDVTLYADAYPGVTYHGKVFGLNAGTGSAFSLLPPQNATGNWIKIVQRLPVRIALDPQELQKHPLQLGLSMTVTTYTYHRKNPMLAEKASAVTVYSTDIYTRQIKYANQVIDDILRENSEDLYLPRMDT